jgi:hypothetical protein
VRRFFGDLDESTVELPAGRAVLAGRQSTFSRSFNQIARTLSFGSEAV